MPGHYRDNEGCIRDGDTNEIVEVETPTELLAEIDRLRKKAHIIGTGISKEK